MDRPRQRRSARIEGGGHAFAAGVRDILASLADAGKAVGMAAYMKDQFAFFGIPTPLRRRATRTAVRACADPLAVAEALWTLSERECQYVACDLLAEHANTLLAEDLERILALVSAKSWWDTVDALAHTVGALVRRQPSLLRRLDALIDDADLWRRRVALLHQLGAKAETDARRLFDYCLRRADEKEFFIRKAIGWALRDFAWHDPDAVRAFLVRHGASLSPLSYREAAKHLR
jgi:3-methyladenine DNA glycosylase AlkD